MTEVKKEEPELSVLTPEEAKAHKGDLKPGEMGWVKLDDEGKPTGAAVKELPKEGGAFARVMVPATKPADELLTPTGAPIMKHMNPEPLFHDPALLLRNPLPDSDGDKKAKPAPAKPATTTHR